MKNPPLVSIICTAYNHEAYIKDALDGFVMQKTTFPFEIIVHDDASTDRTTDIVSAYETKYPELFANIYQTENQYSKGHGDVGRIVFGAARGKYIALCEGDDYWTDPFKLQKQVDFLEANPDYGMCYTKCRYNYENKRQVDNTSWGGTGTTVHDLIKANSIPTLTVVCLRDLLIKYIREIKPERQNWKFGDYPMWLWFSFNSKIQFIDCITGIYRVLPESAIHSRNADKIIDLIKNTNNICQFFNERFSLGYSEYYFNKRCLYKILSEYAHRKMFYLYCKELKNGIAHDFRNMFYLKNYLLIYFFINPIFKNKHNLFTTTLC